MPWSEARATLPAAEAAVSEAAYLRLLDLEKTAGKVAVSKVFDGYRSLKSDLEAAGLYTISPGEDATGCGNPDLL